MNFYQQKIKPYAEKVQAYFNGEEFKNLFFETNGRYFTERYFDDFLSLISGGKCIRAYLTDLFYRAYGGDNQKLALIFACAFELFESAVLMHDDIIDRSELRRGKPSAYVALGKPYDDFLAAKKTDQDLHAQKASNRDFATQALHNGISRAICVGDIGLITATVLTENTFVCAYPNAKKTSAITDQTTMNRIRQAASFQRGIFLTTVSGELADIDLAQKVEFTAQDVINTYIEKTAHYTVIGPALTGAILAGANEQNIKVLREFAINLGVAFQIKDDILGIFNDSETIGKSNLTDIAEGKRSLLLANYLSSAPQKAELDRFMHIYGDRKVDFRRAEFVKAQLLSSGALDKTTEQMNEFFDKAKVILSSLNLARVFKDELLDFIDYLFNRNA